MDQKQNRRKNIYDHFKQYHFELKHLMILLLVLIFFLLLVSYVHKTSIQNLLIKTQDWYQQDSAERMANLTATSLELLVENSRLQSVVTELQKEKIIQAFNIILYQQNLQKNVEDVCLFINSGDSILVIDDGSSLYDFFIGKKILHSKTRAAHREALQLYKEKIKDILHKQEQIVIVRENKQTFNVFVPFVPKGEFTGAVYVKNTPDFSFITREIISSYDETALLFAGMIILGLLAMFYISSYTVKERDEAQELLYREREKAIFEQIEREKEALFTKRIYHTHHKAEKIMGFIKEDLRSLNINNIEERKQRVTKYANFVARVIYDMKWYDPPIQTIRNPMFQTDVNDVIRFLVNNVFLRTAHPSQYRFELNLDESFPVVSINEYVIWEILEPIIQNCVEHGLSSGTIVYLTTHYDSRLSEGKIKIRDNGPGIAKELLVKNASGIKKIFIENVTTKTDAQNSGYGCYLAYQISKKRCGWLLDVENSPDGGCEYTFVVPFKNRRMNASQTTH